MTRLSTWRGGEDDDDHGMRAWDVYDLCALYFGNVIDVWCFICMWMCGVDICNVLRSRTFMGECNMYSLDV